MATHGNATPSPPLSEHSRAAVPNGKLVEYEAFIESQLSKTRSHVWSVELAGNLMLLLVGTLGYFFLAGIVDHWLIPGGLGFLGRLLFLIGYVALMLSLARQVLPLFVRRINPLYAAHTIERSRPSLKNALVNFLLFREDPGRLTGPVYQAIEEQAATNLAKVEVETAVDRSKLIRIGYALVAILVACAIYTVVSPKNLFQSAGRVLMPWALIDAPTQTLIVDIEPGDARAFRGQQVTVKARVEGLGGDGRVTLTYSTDDGQTVNRAVTMTLPPDGYKHTATLPAGDASLQQSLTYRIQAGDAVSRPHRIEVVAAPTIVVRGVEYKYPSYTGLLAQRVEHQGDIKAIEGTEVTLRAVANEPIQAAHIDFDCDNKLDQRMKSRDDEADATFTLSLKEDRQTPTHESYQLVFKNAAEQQNPQPVRHRIEVTRDLAPEIQFVIPQKDEIDLPLNAAVDLEIVANDPDFALRTVKIAATSGTQPLLEKVLLDEAWRGQFVKKFRFEPRKLGLKAGDLVSYSAVAEDNKDPQPNRTTTSPRKIRIVSPDSRQANQDQLAQDDQRGDRQQQPDAKGQGRDDDAPPDPHAQKYDSKNEDKRDDAAPNTSDDKDSQDGRSAQGSDSKGLQQANKPGDAGQDGKSPSGRDGGNGQPNEKGAGQAGSEEGAASDGSNDGDAFERILKHRNEQGKSAAEEKQQTQPRQGDKRPAGDQSRGDDRQAGDDQDQRDAGDTGQEKSQENKRQSDQRRGDDKGAGEKGTGKKDAGQKGADAKRSDDKAPDEKNAGEKGADETGAEKGSPQQGAGDKSGEKSRMKNAERNAAERGDQKGDPSQGQQNGKGSAEGKRSQQKQQPGGQGDAERGKSDRRDQPSAKKEGQRPSQENGQDQQQRQSGEKQPDQGPTKKGAKSQDQPGKGQAGDGQSTDARATDEKGTDQQAAEKSGEESANQPAQKQQGPADGKAKPSEKQDGADSSRASDDQSQRGQSQPAGKQADEKSTAKPDPADSEREGPDTASGEKSTPAANNSEPRPQGDDGAQSKGDLKSQRQQDPSRAKQDAGVKGSAEEKPKGLSGAGQSAQENKGSPTLKDNPRQPRDKSPADPPDDKNQRPDDPAQSPSMDKRESDSQGKEAGEQSGGGKKGGGQKANKPGTGGAGQNSPSDEGAGESEDPGAGETSNRAGNDRQADGKTGQSGSKQGAGSRNKSAEEGQPKAGGDAPGDNSGKSPQPGQPNGESGSPGADNPSGGKPGSNAAPDQPFKPSADKADEANLEYARKATDLALTHLKEELKKDKPDVELLDRLGWTRIDLENFVKRWEQMRAGAQAPGEKGAGARRELDETLRSLGLRPRATSLKSNSARDDKSQGYKESRRTSPPAEYAEQYKAYTQGTARGGK